MGRDEEDANINLGLSRGSTEADRQRYRDYVRAGDSQGSGGPWSPPGGVAILWGLFNRVRRRPATPTDVRTIRIRGAVIGALLGAGYCHYAGKSVGGGAVLGAVVGAAMRELTILALIGIAIWILKEVSAKKETPTVPVEQPASSS